MSVAKQFDGNFCAFCGRSFDPSDPWPRSCGTCQAVTEKMHIPLIAVVAPLEEGFRTTTSHPRSTASGLYLPSTFLDFGETWRQAAARAVGLSSADLQFRNFESMSLDEGVTHIFALVERGAELIDVGQGTQSPGDLTCPHQQAVIKAWLEYER